MKAIIRQLINLQEKDSEVYKLTKKRNLIPEKIEILKKTEQEKSKKINDLKEQYKSAESAKKNQETNLAQTHEKIQKYESQLYDIKHNEEYKKMLKQIEESKASCSTIEEKILIFMENTEKITQQIKSAEQNFSSEKAEIVQKINQANAEKQEFEKEIAVLEEQKIKIKEIISKPILAKYEQIIKIRKDSALAVIKDGTCSACHMMLLAHILDEAKGGKTLVTCDSCSRILYDPDNVQHS